MKNISEENKIAILKVAGITEQDILSALGLDNGPDHKPYTTRELVELTAVPFTTIGKLVKAGKFGPPLRYKKDYRVLAKYVKEFIIKSIIIPDGSFNSPSENKKSKEAVEDFLSTIRYEHIKDSMPFNSKELSELTHYSIRAIQYYIKKGRFGPYLKIGRLHICIGKWVKKSIIKNIVEIKESTPNHVKIDKIVTKSAIPFEIRI